MVTMRNNITKTDLSVIPDICDRIEDIANDIVSHMRLNLGFASNYMPEIILDNNTPEETVGTLNNKMAFQALRSLASRNRYRKDSNLAGMLQHIADSPSEGSFRDILYSFRREIGEVLSNPTQFPNDVNLARECGSIVSRIKSTEKILGRFYPATNKIVLYYNNIGFYKDAHSYDSFLAAITYTLAHEMYHAMHYSIAPEQCAQNTNHAKVVKEASAEFYAFLYSLSTGNTHSKTEAEYSYHDWLTWFITQWPYAKALYYVRLQGKPKMENPDGYSIYDYADYVTYGSLDKLTEVLQLSKYSMDKAFYALVYDEEKYDFSKFPLTHLTLTNNQDDEEGEYIGNPIIRFSIIHYPGMWRTSYPPVKYAFNWQRRQVSESHFRQSASNKVSYYVELYTSRDLMDEFFTIVNSLDWHQNFNELVLDAGSWEVKLTYADGTSETITGNIGTPYGGEALTDLVKEIYARNEAPNAPYIF